MELKGFTKIVIKKENWTVVTAYVQATKMMNLAIGQKHPVFFEGDLTEGEIIQIKGEAVTFKIRRNED